MSWSHLTWQVIVFGGFDPTAAVGTTLVAESLSQKRLSNGLQPIPE